MRPASARISARDSSPSGSGRGSGTRSRQSRWTSRRGERTARRSPTGSRARSLRDPRRRAPRRPGITLDRNAVRAEWTGRPFVLGDTGGFLPASHEGRDADVRRQAEAAIGLADAVLFMVDAKTGVTDLDQAIATQLRRMHGKA